MRKTNKIILFTLIMVVLLLGVGYAAIQNVTLNITGTAAADPSQSNFKVMFTGTPVVSDSNFATASITDDTNATLNVSGLTTKGQTITVEYLVQNISTDLSSDLAVSVVNNNTEYFRITSELAKTSLTAGEVTTLTLTIELIKTPLTEVSSTIGTQLESMPVQPGEEGSSGLTNDFSQTPEKPTLASLTEDNIGDYIDLGNDIVDFNGKTNVTTDDWRILYVEDDTVYAILADYLPANQVPVSTGLIIDTATPQTKPYSAWSNTDKYALLNGLLNTNAWNNFANGISGATATGSPTADLILNSYNSKNGTNLGLYDAPVLTDDLYCPHSNIIDKCSGYWIATEADEWEPESLIIVQAPGNFASGACSCYNTTDIATRPVVALPASLTCELVNGVWVVD